MTSLLVPGRNPDLEHRALGTLLSAVAYGLEISLYVSCMRGFLMGEGDSKRTRQVLIAYISIMLLLGTLALLQDCFILTTAVFQVSPNLQLLSHVTPFVALPFTIWGADGFMIWRCAVLYQGLPRVPRVIMNCFFVSLLLVSLASGIVLFSAAGTLKAGSINVLISLSTLANILVSAFIALRLLYHQKFTIKLMGAASGSVYTRIMIICVESCFLILVFTILYLTLSNKSSTYLVPLLLLPHICVISPLLLVDRVARGREAKVAQRPSEVTRTSIHFTNPISTISQGGGEQLEEL
ncbi:hypothetical protein GALMADRAFT_231887 [Galerina marginata CBS 339.88]|uniref:Uncharacterized protein n=1 Tax=Galerina marginata (strain CBS 339.88) TaxID=685588 RepID=A0A067SCJ8_GALM3|nr:hypothetical protein GALMADRAFT_231887 [Galerina marginata CBS 339.88]